MGGVVSRRNFLLTLQIWKLAGGFRVEITVVGVHATAFWPVECQEARAPGEQSAQPLILLIFLEISKREHSSAENQHSDDPLNDPTLVCPYVYLLRGTRSFDNDAPCMAHMIEHTILRDGQPNLRSVSRDPTASSSTTKNDWTSECGWHNVWSACRPPDEWETLSTLRPSALFPICTHAS